MGPDLGIGESGRGRGKLRHGPTGTTYRAAGVDRGGGVGPARAPYAVGMTSSENQNPADPAGVETVELAIEGMHCGSCSALIEETLSEQPGVLDASVDLDAARAVIRFDRNLLGANDLCGLVSGVGYEATVFETT